MRSRALIIALLAVLALVAPGAGADHAAVRTLVLEPPAGGNWLVGTFSSQPADWGWHDGWWCMGVAAIVDVPHEGAASYIILHEPLFGDVRMDDSYVVLGDQGFVQVRCTPTEQPMTATFVVIAAADELGSRVTVQFQPSNTFRFEEQDWDAAPRQFPDAAGGGAELSYYLETSPPWATLVNRNVETRRDADVSIAGVETGAMFGARIDNRMEGPSLHDSSGRLSAAAGVGQFAVSTTFGGTESIRREFFVPPLSSATFRMQGESPGGAAIEIEAGLLASAGLFAEFGAVTIPVDLGALGLRVADAARADGTAPAPARIDPACLDAESSEAERVSCIVGE